MPLLRFAAGILLLMPGWYVCYITCVMWFLGERVYEDPYAGGSGAFIVKYCDQHYRYEDIAHFQSESWWRDEDHED